MMEAGVCRFTNRHTALWERCYVSPRATVWNALVNHASEWFAVRPVTIDARLGGRGIFGAAHSPVWQALVDAFEPGRVIGFDHPDGFPEGGALRFELTEQVNATRLVMSQTFRPGIAVIDAGHVGADLPLGASAPWRPGFLAGFHMMFDSLGAYLGLDFPAPSDERWIALVSIYREHIRRSVPVI
jgi:uncharacterized protein YndB with AHSA1/START domain